MYIIENKQLFKPIIYHDLGCLLHNTNLILTIKIAIHKRAVKKDEHNKTKDTAQPKEIKYHEYRLFKL